MAAAGAPGRPRRSGPLGLPGAREERSPDTLLQRAAGSVGAGAPSSACPIPRPPRWRCAALLPLARPPAGRRRNPPPRASAPCALRSPPGLGAGRPPGAGAKGPAAGSGASPPAKTLRGRERRESPAETWGKLEAAQQLLSGDLLYGVLQQIHLSGCPAISLFI